MSKMELSQDVRELMDTISKSNGIEDYSIFINSGSLSGGYSSDIRSLVISENNSNRKLHIVYKLIPQNENQKEHEVTQIIYKREALFYDDFVPIFEKFQEEKNVPKDDQFISYPKCYGTIINDIKKQYVIALEDLRPKGFRMWNKMNVSPIENVRLVMRELGKFHGVSLALKHQNPEVFAPFTEITDTLKVVIKSEFGKRLFELSLNRAIKAMKNEEHKNALEEIKKDISSFVEHVLDNKSPFAVLAHGDCWNNNLLYRFKDEVAEDIRIVDWQLIRYASPATDLVYNIFPSTDKALRDKEYDNLLRLYHNSLSKTVKLLGSNPDELFSYQNLQDELKKYGQFVLLLAPIVIHSSQINPRQGEGVNEGEIHDNIGNGGSHLELIAALKEDEQKEYERRLNEVVEDVFRLGYFYNINQQQ